MSDLTEGGRQHREIFLNTIKSLSVVPQNYLTEWELVREQGVCPNIHYPHDDEDWICECGMKNRRQRHNRCICRQHIDYFHTLRNRITGDIIYIGSECAKQYLNIHSPENTCLECGQYTRKHSTNLCTKCRKTCTLDRGQYKGISFHRIYEINKAYCSYVMKYPNPSGRFILFIKWLEHRGS